MNRLSARVKSLRRQFNMTQEELSVKSGVGLRFVRDLEQGKSTLRLDKVIGKYAKLLPEMKKLIDISFLNDELKDKYVRLIAERIDRLME